MPQPNTERTPHLPFTYPHKVLPPTDRSKVTTLLMSADAETQLIGIKWRCLRIIGIKENHWLKGESLAVVLCSTLRLLTNKEQPEDDNDVADDDSDDDDCYNSHGSCNYASGYALENVFAWVLYSRQEGVEEGKRKKN